ncbi:MAG: DUF2169 domain-containing protein [Desulfovibrio sp.]|jgi:uncharacterized protein YjbI with pentapeptide repeats|nr:DUF2169 domain-containing protein [Desulfovibrio sp.]
MKIFKERRHALFNRPVEIAGKHYLSLGVMLYFDLTAPDELHTEQELWKELVALLGPEMQLDQGWPKPHGEVLCAGHACAPGGRPTPAVKVRLRCGRVDKTLNVFGDRYWVRGGDGAWRLSEAKPFATMPLDWQHAFGGPEFKDNPLGKGMEVKTRPDGVEVIPLPNVEGEPPATPLIGAPTDRPAPASFGPLDLMWPARAKKNGTYDDAWVKTRWPALPDDMNYEFFCMAPEDQYLPSHFDGHEVIEVEGMHKDMPVISSRLPHVRVRAFVTRRDMTSPEDLARASFEEVGLKPETLWLFPEILRGVILWRGMAACVDDEYADLGRLFVADEPRYSEPRAIEHYRDLQLKKADLSVPFDPAMQLDFQRKMAAGAKRVLNLPKELKERQARSQGQAPAMVMSPQDVDRAMRARLKDIRATIDSVEASTTDVHQRFGHLAATDLGAFPRARAQADKMEARLDAMLQRAQAMEQRKAEMLEQARGMLKRPQMRLMADLKDKGDLEKLLEKPGEPPFHAMGFPLVVSWRVGLDIDQERMRELSTLGIERGTVKRRWLAWNPEAREERAADWGVKPQPGQETFRIPAGLVLPGFSGAKLDRLLVRPSAQGGALDDPASDVLVLGSRDEPLFLEAASEQGVVAIVGDELSAAFIEQEAGDFAHVAVCAAPGAPLAKQAAEALKQGAQAVALWPEAGPWAGKEADFEKALPGCRFARLPEAKDVFHAHKKGQDVRQAIVEQLPPDKAQEHSLIFDAPGAPKKPGAKKLEDILSAASIIDLIQGGVADAEAAKEAKFAPYVDAAKERAAAATARMAKEGFVAPPAQPSALSGQPSMTELMNLSADKAEAIRDKMGKMGSLTPEAEAKLNGLAAKLRATGPQLDAQKAEGKAALKAFQLLPEHAQALAKAGLDPAKLRPQKPELVLAAAKGQAGADVTGATIKDLDFSGQDLSGIDFSKARISKCLFKGTKLAGARLDEAMIQGCDFTGADVSGASLHRTVLKESLLDKANLRGAVGEMTIIQKSSLKEADLSECDLKQAVVQHSALAGLKLTNARLALSVFSDGDATGLTADGARFEKCVFKKAGLDKASFRGITTDALLLHTCAGEKVSFAGSELFKFRISHDSQFPGLNLGAVVWKQGYCRKANLAGADLQGSELERTIFDSCDMTRANLAKVRLRRCRFLKTDLEAATLHFADLFMASMRKARLVQADMRGANCYAVDFFKAVFGETRMEGANLKRSLIDGHEQGMRAEGLII